MVERDSEEELNVEAEPFDGDEICGSEVMWTSIEEGPDEEAERIALRKASLENLYTPNIEALLEGLEGDLKVVPFSYGSQPSRQSLGFCGPSRRSIGCSARMLRSSSGRRRRFRARWFSR